MADEERPRNSIEALIDRPLFEHDTGGRGIGPTLGVRAPHPQPASSGTTVWPSDENAPDLCGEPSERRPDAHRLGSEIAAAGEDLSGDVLRAPQPPGQDDLPGLARIQRGRPGVAAPDLLVPPPGGRRSGGRGL